MYTFPYLNVVCNNHTKTNKKDTSRTRFTGLILRGKFYAQCCVKRGNELN